MLLTPQLPLVTHSPLSALPCCGNLGGGGFMLIHLADGENLFLNFREKAPLGIKPNTMYFDADGKPLMQKMRIGYLAVGVPGTVMGLNTALKKYGTMSLKQVMAPAIKLAKLGYRLTPGDMLLYDYGYKYFLDYPNTKAIFTKDGKPYQTGDLFKQEDLAKSLELIANNGTKAFYQGAIAKTIIKASDDNGGALTQEDFDDYTVQWLTPITCHYHGNEIISAPPPSSGGVALCEMLNILNIYPIRYLGFHSAQTTHYMVEAMRYAFADRNQYLGDPDFVNNPINWLLSKKHTHLIQSRIQRFSAGDSKKIGFLKAKNQEQMQTTHYSIVDKDGNAVAGDLYVKMVISAPKGYSRRYRLFLE